MDLATSYRQLAAATGYSVSTLHGMRKKGQIPERGPQGWVVVDVLAAMAENIDPGRRSEDRSAPNAERTAERTRAAPRLASAGIAESGTFPVPAAYRDRTDLGDAFARGALYGAHVVAYGLPTAAASAAIDAGAGRALALKIHKAAKTDAAFIVGDVTEALSLVPAGTDDAGPHAPTAFGSFDPSTFASSAP